MQIILKLDIWYLNYISVIWTMWAIVFILGEAYVSNSQQNIVQLP